jgi:hypothetical protein
VSRLPYTTFPLLLQELLLLLPLPSPPSVVLT